MLSTDPSLLKAAEKILLEDENNPLIEDLTHRIGQGVTFHDDWKKQKKKSGTLVAVRRSSKNPWKVGIVRLQDGSEVEVHPDRIAEEDLHEMSHSEIQTDIHAQQIIQQRNHPSSAAWKQASDRLRYLVGQLKGKPISQANWDLGKTR